MPTAIEVRPSLRALFRWEGARLRSGRLFFIPMIGLIIGAASGTLAFGRGRTAVVLIIAAGGVAVLLAVAGALAIVYFMTTKLAVKGDRIELVSFGSRKEWQRNELARVVRCARSSPMGFSPDRLSLLLDRQGRLLLILATAYWKESDLQPLWDRLQIPVEGQWTDVSSYEDLAKQFPAA
jgi:hypothetical protein